MDAFENLMKILLERKGFWVRNSVKVNLTKEERRKIGRPTAPRWELDLVAYSAPQDEIYVIECKSYLDSPGVDLRDLQVINRKNAKRYKLFTDEKLREVVFGRLRLELVEGGFCTKKTKIILGLAAGKTHGDKSELEQFFKKEKMNFYGPEWIKSEIELMKFEGYENNIAYIVSKILLR